MTEEEIVAEATRRYPIGTKFISAIEHGGKNTVKAIGMFQKEYSGRKNILWNSSSRTTATGPGWLYYDGKWAEVVQYPDGKKPEVEVTNYSIY